jgi:hypothetical protein
VILCLAGVNQLPAPISLSTSLQDLGAGTLVDFNDAFLELLHSQPAAAPTGIAGK